MRRTAREGGGYRDATRNNGQARTRASGRRALLACDDSAHRWRRLPVLHAAHLFGNGHLVSALRAYVAVRGHLRRNHPVGGHAVRRAVPRLVAGGKAPAVHAAGRRGRHAVPVLRARVRVLLLVRQLGYGAAHRACRGRHPRRRVLGAHVGAHLRAFQNQARARRRFPCQHAVGRDLLSVRRAAPAGRDGAVRAQLHRGRHRPSRVLGNFRLTVVRRKDNNCQTKVQQLSDE